jgi:HTH-type transcriptional regulator/antitoxin HigA
MKIKIFKTKKDYDNAMKRMEVLFDAKKGSIEGAELLVLGILIDQYEKEHFPIDLPDPVEAIKFRMEQLGYTQADLAEMLGKNRASEILNRKRKLSLEMIRQLHEHLRIPTEVLIQVY